MTGSGVQQVEPQSSLILAKKYSHKAAVKSETVKVKWKIWQLQRQQQELFTGEPSPNFLHHLGNAIKSKASEILKTNAKHSVLWSRFKMQIKCRMILSITKLPACSQSSLYRSAACGCENHLSFFTLGP